MSAPEILSFRLTGAVEVRISTRVRSCRGLTKAWVIAVGVLGLSFLMGGTSGIHSAWAAEPSSDVTNEAQTPAETVGPEPSADGGDEEAAAAPEGPRQGPRFLPPRLRPTVLTAEEHAEAERLKKLAAKYGTDPTAIIGRVQLSAQYQNLQNDAHARDGTFRVDLPIRGNWLFRVDTPFLKWVDPNRTGATTAQGLSDLSALLGWRAYNTPEYAFFIGVLSSFPTADQPTLGLGKYTVGPLLATARFLPRWESFLFGVFQHQVSVGGDPARADVEVTRASVQVNTIWADRWWTILQSVWQINWERNAKSSMTLEFEVGRNLIGRLGAFLRPGVGIWGRDLIGAYDWNIEVGVRYMFGSL